jgi:hypothetical protein
MTTHDSANASGGDLERWTDAPRGFVVNPKGEWCRYDEAAARIREMERGHMRYEEVRTWTPQTFKAVWLRNIEGNEPFDGIVDEFIARPAVVPSPITAQPSTPADGIER